MKPYLFLFAILLFCFGCEKAPDLEALKAAANKNMEVKITSTVPFSYGLTEFIVGSNNLTLDLSGSNVTTWNHSFTPISGQKVVVAASTSTQSDLQIIVTYKGKTYNSTSPEMQRTSSPTFGTETEFQYLIP